MHHPSRNPCAAGALTSFISRRLLTILMREMTPASSAAPRFSVSRWTSSIKTRAICMPDHLSAESAEKEVDNCLHRGMHSWPCLGRHGIAGAGHRGREQGRTSLKKRMPPWSRWRRVIASAAQLCPHQQAAAAAVCRGQECRRWSGRRTKLLGRGADDVGLVQPLQVLLARVP